MKSIKDSYKKYKENSEQPVDLKEYLTLAAEFNQFLINKVLRLDLMIKVNQRA
jgi:hypothetical protein